MTRHWTINGRFLTQPFSGVQRYAHEITRELDTLVQAGHALARGLTLEIAAPPGAVAPELRAVRVRTAGNGGGHPWEQFVLPRHVPGGLLSLCNTGPLAVQRQIVCIHDANTRLAPGSYSWPFRTLYRILHPLLGRRARRIATVSRTSRDALVRFGIAREEKIVICPNGHEHALRWQPALSPAVAPLADGRTVLVIGSPAPHKNVAVLLKIAGSLAAGGLRLAVAGVRDARVFQGLEGENCGAWKNVHWLGRLSDGELAALLQGSLCLAFPSLAEGFGIPAVEAMAWGCPVVASDRTSLPETCGSAALYADPFDPAAWRAQILLLARDAEARAFLAAKGREQAARFSWRTSAEAYLAEMARIDGMATSGAGPKT